MRVAQAPAAVTVTPELLLQLQRPVEVELSSDGARLAYTVSPVYREKGGVLEARLWVDGSAATESGCWASITGRHGISATESGTRWPKFLRLRNWMARLRWMKPMSAERKSDGVSTLAQKPRKLWLESGNAAAICVSSTLKMPRAAHWRNTSRRMSAATWM